MSSGSTAQGFAAFAPQSGGFAAAGATGVDSAPTATGFGATASSAAATGGFRFDGAAKTSEGGFVFPSTTSTATSSVGFGGTGPSMFGKTMGAPSSSTSVFWKPPPPTAPTFVNARTGPSAFGGSNPMGRGLSTRACFAVNDDQRFTKPAFQASKPSVWSLVTSVGSATPLSLPPPQPKWSNFTPGTTTALFGGQPHVPSVPGWGERTTVPSTAFAPTPVVEPNGQTVQYMSISAQPEHESVSVEELRLSTRAKTAPQTLSFDWGKPAPVVTDTAWTGFTFGGDSNAPGPEKPLTTFGPQPADAGNPFARPSEPLKSSRSVFNTGFAYDGGAQPATASSGRSLFTNPSTSPFGVVPSGNTTTGGTTTTSSSATTSGGLFSPSASGAPGTFTPLFGLPSTTATPQKPSLFWRPPTEKPAPPPAPRTGFLFGTNERWTGPSQSDQPPTFSFVEKAGPDEQISQVRFGGSDLPGLIGGGDASPSPTESVPAEQPAVPADEAVEVPSGPESLALPRLPQSYSKVAGSRARAFVRRAGAGGSRSFGPHSARLAVAAMTSSRKFTQELSPVKKPIERIVVGRRDAEPWKHTGSHFTSSLFAKSAQATAIAFAAETQGRGAEAPSEAEEDVQASALESELQDEAEQKPLQSSESLDLDNYDL